MPTLPKPVDQTRLPRRLRTTTKTMHHRRVRQQALSTRHVRQALSTLVRQTTERTPHMTTVDHRKPCDGNPECLHLTCSICGIRIRTGDSRAKDHPGTRVGTQKAQQCTQCVRRGGPPKERPKQCATCETPFRARQETLADRPGTVHHQSNGDCPSCYHKKRRAEDLEYEREHARLKSAKRLDNRAQRLADERHVLLKDKDMARLQRVAPVLYAWHIARRKRINAPLPASHNPLKGNTP